ncbi:MAG: protein kinase [Gemmatimonadota bacterium]|nr:protein kinase [Gemmatimonadota bacterium]
MDLAARLRETLGSTYRIERELPAGGMSRVFLAEEVALGREVVVKVLPADFAAGVSAERFSREIQLAAKLQQANIVPLISFGVVDALPYYTMPYVAGESLRTKLSSSGALSVSQSLGILRDVARALTYAHERGIVHRDIKPENVLLSGDAAVVTDFGIAKAINASISGDSGTLTMTGTVVGTPAYIAPEQAAGDPATDHRADFYSFGCLAYELLSGHPPFSGKNPQALLMAHLTETPKAIGTLVPDLPPHVAQLISRCLEKLPAARPQSGREILQVLDTVHSPLQSASSSESKFDKRYAFAIVAALVLLAGGYATIRARGGASDVAGTARAKAVAVLPFTNAGGDSADTYFADGMADELIAALGKVPVLSVASRRSAFALKQRSDLDITSIGRMLHVDAVLEGTVRRAGDRLRVTAQLTNTSDGLTLWSDSYERQAKDVFAVQDDITKSIVNALSLKLGNGQRQPTTNLSAYDDYLRGSYALEQRGAGVRKSVEFLNSAIAKDSAFARAYGKLSEALQLLPYFAGVSAASVEKQTIAAANRALALDSTDAEAHIGLALAMGHSFHWNEEERQYRLAIAADTNNAVARTQYGRHLLQVARIPEAIVQLKRAIALDPLSGTQAVWLATATGLNGDSASALHEALDAVARFQNLDLAKLQTAYELIRWGRFAEAQKLVEVLPASLGFRGQSGYILGKSGDTPGALALIRELKAMPDPTWLVHTALVYSYLGVNDTTQALNELERAVKTREILPKWMPLGHPMFDPIRGSPRFAAALSDFGLDSRLFTPPNRGRPGK